MTATPISIQGWSLDKVLGSGGFGSIELWVHTSGKKLAIKICKKDIKQLTETQQKRWIHEVQIMKCLRHPNIIQGLELPFKHPDDKINQPVLCMEFCRRGDLRKVLNNVENCCGVTEEVAVNVIKDISSAVEYLHSNNITHRDLKPENIVLQDGHNTISYKLIDLGYAKELGEDSISGSLVGTLNYVAPELLWKQTYSCSVDYWSLGILIYELITGTRPFLPKMQHTMTWMQYIKNKSYKDIRAVKTDGKIIFGQDIARPTNLSKFLQKKLVEWFRVVLQWDPKQRGKQYDDNGTQKLVVFELLHSILSNKIVYVFCASVYKMNAYEVVSTTSIVDLQSMIQKDIGIPINQQTLTDYFGNILTNNGVPLLSQIQDRVLFVFNNENPLIDSIPKLDIPIEVESMLQRSRCAIDFDMLQDYYRITIFFIKQEMYLFQLYIFALSINVDLLMARVGTFNEKMTNIATTINTLLKELQTKLPNTSQNRSTNTEGMNVNFKKMTNLVKASNQIKSTLCHLIEESNNIKDVVQSVAHVKDMSEIYYRSTQIYQQFKEERNQKGEQPTEMVKLVFEFLKIQEAQFRVKNIPELRSRIITVQEKLTTLEAIFNSVTTMTTIYHKEIQNIIPCAPNDNVGFLTEKHSHAYNTTHVNTDVLEYNEFTEKPKELNREQTSNTSATKVKDTSEDSNVIYDNLVLRYTLDNLLAEMQRKLVEFLNLET